MDDATKVIESTHFTVEAEYEVDGFITGLPGVEELDDPGSVIVVRLMKGGNVASLTVTDGKGVKATAFLGRHQVFALFGDLGLAASHM